MPGPCPSRPAAAGRRGCWPWGPQWRAWTPPRRHVPSSCPAIRSSLSFLSVPKNTSSSGLAGQISRADDAGVGAKRGPREVYVWPVMSSGQALFEGRPRGTDEQFTRLAHAAADDEAARVAYGRQVGHPLPQPAAYDPETAQRRQVTLA